MRRRHFQAFSPHCPVCARLGHATPPLVLANVAEEQDGDIRQGVLHCPNPDCQHEYPIIDGIPVIVPDLTTTLAEQSLGLLLRDDLDPALEGLLGDALGQNSWFDALRQTASTYGWDHWADLDPEEPAQAPRPGAASACLAALCDMAGDEAPDNSLGAVLDLGCGAGRTSFDLAARHRQALILGIDLHAALLRLAQSALHGRMSYPRRRIGLVYDRRRFAVHLQGADRVDFWACDAAALPFAAGGIDLITALHLLDCLPKPLGLLTEGARVLRPGGAFLLATPYDWSSRATPPQTWIGGHSQRAAHRGAAEPALHALLGDSPHPQTVRALRVQAEATDFPWQTRLHDRATMSYRSHLLALRRVRDAL